MIEVSNLTKTINGKKILDNISFQIPEKSITGFVGKNGAGKTTSMEILASCKMLDLPTPHPP